MIRLFRWLLGIKKQQRIRVILSDSGRPVAVAHDIDHAIQKVTAATIRRIQNNPAFTYTQAEDAVLALETGTVMREDRLYIVVYVDTQEYTAYEVCGFDVDAEL